jgi:oxygen-dependent protoporphyrinogen oxidase
MTTAADSERVDVAIVGGGIAGLTVAYDLRQSGCRTLVLESRQRLGGVIATTRTKDLVLEGGPDALLVQKPAGVELCRELGLGPYLVSTLEPRTAFVLRSGRLHSIPAATHLGLPLTTEALEGLTMLSEEGRARVAEDLTNPRGPQHDGDESIGAFLSRRFGGEFVAAIAQPLLGGIHAGDVSRLSVRALFPELARLDAAGGSLLEALRARRVPRDPDGLFRGLDGGMGRLVESIAAKLPDRAVRVGSTVTAVSRGDRFVLEVSQGRRVEARSIVLAVPAWQAADLVSGLDATLSAACRAIPYVSSATIALAYRRAAVGRPPAGMGFVVPRGEATRLLAVSWVSSKWPRRAPGDVVLIRAFAGGALERDHLDLDDATLVSQVHDDLAGLLAPSSRPIHTRVDRWDNAGPQYEVGHLDRVARIESAASRWPGLFLTGSALHGVGIPDTVEAARRTARAVRTALGS